MAYSWTTIEKEDDKYTVVFHNQAGVERAEFTSSNLNEAEAFKAKRDAFTAKVVSAMKRVMEKLQNDPEAMRELQESTEESSTPRIRRNAMGHSYID